jgi:hypothetical protein
MSPPHPRVTTPQAVKLHHAAPALLSSMAQKQQQQQQGGAAALRVRLLAVPAALTAPLLTGVAAGAEVGAGVEVTTVTVAGKGG